MSGTGTPIIIKKIKKRDHGGAHGGSWKVAYADFVTAMMAFFLLLWLISMVSEDKRAKVSQYFKHFSLFEKGGQSFMMDNNVSKNQIGIIDTGESGEVKSQDTKPDQPEPPPTSTPDVPENTTANTADGIKEILKKEIESKLASIKDQILLDIDDGASRIEIIDKNGGMLMFSSGSREMTPEGKKALSVIAESIKGIKGRIAIEGHTDALKYAGTQYSNWELSTERASAARRELESSGISPDKFIRVAGYAATDPLIKEDALDPRNRRISIRVFPDSPQNPASGDGSQTSQGTATGNSGDIKKDEKDQALKNFDPVGNYLLSR